MNWRLSQPLLIPLILLACAPTLAAGSAAPPVDAQPTGNTPASAPAVPPAAGASSVVSPSTVPPADATIPAAPQPPTGSIGSPVPVPTDQTPPEVKQPSPIPLGETLLVSGAVDARYRTATTGRTRQAWLNETEVDLDRPFTHTGQPIGDIRLQVVAENPPGLRHAQDVQLGEAYVLYKLPFQTDTDSTVYLKVGQFQLPFGLLAVYDPHLLILQPLYAQSIGLRTDFGVEVSGRYYGYLNYDFSLTTGSGPNHYDLSPNRVIVFRLGRTFITRNGTVNIGGSLLQGHLPNTDLDAAFPYSFELPPSGYVRADRGYTAKTRIAGDGTITYKSLTGRGEAMIGADQNSRVAGYFGEVDYRLSARAYAVAGRALWEYPQSNSLSERNSIGLTYAPDTNLTLRALYENLYDVPVGAPSRTRHQFTVQVLLRF